MQGNLFHREFTIRYEIENFKDKPVTLRIVERMNQTARKGQYGRDPHGDVEWQLGGKTSKAIDFDYEFGHAAPALRVKLPARPKDKDEEVKKQTFIFHFTIKNLW